jgi:hypothetical protein
MDDKRSVGLIAVASAGVGAATAYVFDPRLGKSRRKKARDRLAGAFRHTTKRATRTGRRLRAVAIGRTRRVRHAIGRHDHTPVDDITLVQRVESRLFRDSHVPKGDLNVDAAGGTVHLRGVVQSPDQIRQIETVVAKVPGVARLESFLHVEGTPAPNKVDALSAGWGLTNKF